MKYIFILTMTLVNTIPMFSQELTENNASEWTSFADVGGATFVNNSTLNVVDGDYSVEFITEGGFATGVSYPATNDANWNLESSTLYFSFYAINNNFFGFQEPVKVKLYSGNDFFEYSANSIPITETLYQFSISLDNPNCQWTRISEGNPSLSNITSVEFIWDTWDTGFTVYLDGVEFIAGNNVIANASYNELSNLIVVLRSHDGDQLTSSLSEIESAADKTSLFYWKHSKHKLLLNWNYMEIPENVELWGNEQDGVLSPSLVQQLLLQKGVVNNQYDAITVLSPNGGNYGWISGNILLGKSGFCHMSWTRSLDAKYWVLTHEINHTTDGLMKSSGYPEYPYNHPGSARDLGEYIPPSGPDFDLNAQFMLAQEASRWLDLATCGVWGTIKSFTDLDGDGFADDDSSLPMDELRFGSSSSMIDSDNDGLTDLQEHYAGMQTSTDPTTVDTDGDGILDGFDRQPLYGLLPVIPNSTVIPGSANFSDYHFVGVQNGADLYASFDENYLHMAIDKNPFAGGRYDLHFDFRNDGLFHGEDNLYLEFVGDSFNSLRVRDAANAGSSDYLDQSIPLNSIIATTANGGNEIYLSIPVSPVYDFNSDLGRTIGFRMNGSSPYQTLFEWDDYLEMTLGEDCPEELRITSFPVDPYVYRANEYIKTTGLVQNSPSGIQLKAGQFILLEEDFEVNQGSILDVAIATCL